MYKKVIFALTFFVSCSGIFYHPSKKTYSGKISHPYTEITVHSKSGSKLNTWYFKTKNAKGLLLFFHGNAQNISAQYRSFIWILDYNYDYLVFDYSGYGKSSGSPSQKALFLDGISMLEYAIKLKNENHYPLIALGQSLGGAVLISSAGAFKNNNQIDIIIADCSFPSYVELADYYIKNFSMLPVPSRLFFIKDEYAPAKFLNRLKQHKLVSHCKQDKTVPFFLGEKLFEQLSEPKEFWELDCEHGRFYCDKTIQNSLIRFIQTKTKK